MSLTRSACLLVLASAGWLTISEQLVAAPTAEQKKELADIQSDAKKVASLVGRKKTDEAEETLKECEDRLKKLIADAQLPDSDPQVKAAQRLLETQRALLAKAAGGKSSATAVSFAKDVAPILASKCDTCHGDRGAGGLKLESYATMKAGGRNGPVLQVGNPQASLLIQRVASVNPANRMPKDAEALSQDEIKTLWGWIAAGAKFDGADESVAVKLLAKNPEAGKQPKVEIVKATGSETVSFVRDVAPTFVNTCGNCHGRAENPSGGLSMVTFERLMAGGDSGRAIKPGDVDGSLMFEKLKNGEMPRGNMTGITRKWYGDFQTWIREGAKFDGNDAKRPLRELIPTPEQLLTEALAKLTPEAWSEKRHRESKEIWTRVFPQGGEPGLAQTADFLVMGDVAPRRLEQVGEWAQDQAAHIRTMFQAKEEPLFKGKLTIFVLKDRFGYEEFNSTIHAGREVPREVLGHSDVTAAQDRAFAAVQDIGDDATATSPGMPLNVAEHVTGAYLKRGGGALPDWLVRGTGLALAAGKSAGGNPYLSSLRGHAADALRKSNLGDAADVFNGGQFSPADAGPIGYMLVEFLLKNGGPAKFGRLVQRFQANDKPAQAIQTAYNVDARTLGVSFVSSLGNVATPAPKKKKN